MEIGDQELWFAAAVSPMLDDSVLVVARDVSMHKHAERSLLESEQKYRQVIDNATEGIVVVQDKRIKLFNPKALEISACTAEELSTKSILDFVHPEDREIVLRNHERRLNASPPPPPYVFRLVDKQGNLRWLETSGVAIQWEGAPATLNFLTDVTQRLRAEKVQSSIYRISEAVFSTQSLQEYFQSVHAIISELLPANNFSIALYDAEEDKISFPYFVDQFDSTPTPRKAGRGLTEYVLRTGDSLLARPETFTRLAKEGEIELTGMPSVDWLGVPLKAKDKNIGVLAVQSYRGDIRFDEADKNLLQFVSTQIGIAIERKQNEEQIKASLKEKEVLLKEIHHRVKNNLQIISSLLNLQTNQISDERALEMFRDSQNRVRTMALIHEKLYRSMDLARINFAEYVQNLAKALYRSYSKNLALIEMEVNVEEVLLDIDTAIPCGLIITELVSNSLKHAFPDGSKGRVGIRLNSVADNRMNLTVYDNGVGLPPSLQFEHTDSLGLQLVSTLTAQLEGELKVSSTGGTAVSIVFPVAEKPQQAVRV